MRKFFKAVSVVELIITVFLLGTVMLAATSLDRFIRYHTVGGQRRAYLQNEVSFILEHMAKNISRAIGNPQITGADSVVNIYYSPTAPTYISVFIDANNNGLQDTSGDHYICYYYEPAILKTTDICKIFYCADSDSNCNCRVNREELTNGNIGVRGYTIAKFVPSYNSSRNFVDIDLTACWDAVNADLVNFPGGTPDNPCVRMTNRIYMPGVSLN